jgi:hypothetical protein
VQQLYDFFTSGIPVGISLASQLRQDGQSLTTVLHRPQLAATLGAFTLWWEGAEELVAPRSPRDKGIENTGDQT